MTSRHIAASISAVLAAALIAPVLNILLNAQAGQLSGWWPFPIAAGGTFALLAFGFLIPKRVLAGPLKRARQIELVRFFRILKHQRRRPVNWIRFERFDMKFLAPTQSSNGKNSRQWECSLILNSFLLRQLKIDRLRLTITKCPDARELEGERIVFEDVSAIFPLTSQRVGPSSDNLPDPVYAQLAERAKESPVDRKLLTTVEVEGSVNGKRIFNITGENKAVLTRWIGPERSY